GDYAKQVETLDAENASLKSKAEDLEDAVQAAKKEHAAVKKELDDTLKDLAL
ncbi:hypothetical protein SARC_14156, partial [Sphaeroforma arctica JP610]